jgi:hypothetical protein
MIVPNYPTDPRIWQKWFTTDVNRPATWILTARDLLASLGLFLPQLKRDWQTSVQEKQLAPPVNIHRIFLLLSAYTFENLLKAIIVHRSAWPDSIVERNIPHELKNHILLSLASSASISLTIEEQELLERLTEFAIWRGRYPVPTRIEAIQPKKLRSGIVTTAGSMRGSDMREVEQFCNRLIAMLDKVPGGEILTMLPVSDHEEFDNHVVSSPIRAS